MMPLVGKIAKRIEFPVLLAAITIAGGLFGFIEMMEVARATEPHAFDTAILLFFREAGQSGGARSGRSGSPTQCAT